jgi:hypothetical protein
LATPNSGWLALLNGDSQCMQTFPSDYYFANLGENVFNMIAKRIWTILASVYFQPKNFRSNPFHTCARTDSDETD